MVSHLLQRKPHSFTRKLHLDTGLTILALIYDYLIVIVHVANLLINSDIYLLRK